MTKLIILFTLFCITQYCISFLCFLELFFTFFITRMHIRMVLLGKSTECLFYISVTRILRNAKDFIIISFLCHNA